MRPRVDEPALIAAEARVQVLVAQPAAAAIIDRAGRLTDEERARLHTAWIQHYRIYRAAQSYLGHRCTKAYGEHWRDLLVAKEHARLAERAGLGVYEGPWWGASCAAVDAMEAVLVADLLEPHEVPIFTTPWETVVGPVTSPRAT